MFRAGSEQLPLSRDFARHHCYCERAGAKLNTRFIRNRFQPNRHGEQWIVACDAGLRVRVDLLTGENLGRSQAREKFFLLH